jgi:voltage-gated sodium channel
MHETVVSLASDPWRERLGRWVESARVQQIVIGLVLLNAITLGLETLPAVMAQAGVFLKVLDRTLLVLFVMELTLKLAAHGARFFRGGWNVFDLAVVAIALIPASGPLSVFRALRVLRILRLVSAVPKMRIVVEALARSLPGLGSIGLLLLIFFYVFAVVATKLFSAEFPQWFGTLWTSMFSLFQIMTLEGWADIAREVMERYAGAWLFFVAFILLATFTVLNLFIALIVNAMEDPAISGPPPSTNVVAGAVPCGSEILALRDQVAALRTELASYIREAECRQSWRDSDASRKPAQLMKPEVHAP